MAKAQGRLTKKRAQSKVKSAKSKPRVTNDRAALPNVWKLTVGAMRLLWLHKTLFLGISLIYGVLNFVLVQGLSSNADIGNLKVALDQIFSGHLASLASGFTVFVILIGSGGGGNNNSAAAYQLFLILITSLAVIWSLRQVQAGKWPRTRDSFYQGIYPLIPFLLVLLVIGVQLVPLAIGGAVYSVVIGAGIASTALESAIWLMVFLGLAWASLYFVTASIFALYIVTLPDMTPMKALRSARELVRHRRLLVFRKLLWLPVALLIVAAVVMLPVITWITPLAPWLFFLLTLLVIPVANAYLYNLYRELLNE
ncbi:MAG TPA: hypothetical protein VHB51_02140 [Candidatus Saccharimonadales bacterium]|nr:hypothetical protein [Candidatus Saccharimonadales bacterium]